MLTYPCMSWYYVRGNLYKIGSSEDFLMNFFLFFFCLLAVLQRNQLGRKQKTLQQHFTLSMIGPLGKKTEKIPKAQHKHT